MITVERAGIVWIKRILGIYHLLLCFDDSLILLVCCDPQSRFEVYLAGASAPCLFFVKDCGLESGPSSLVLYHQAIPQFRLLFIEPSKLTLSLLIPIDLDIRSKHQS